MCPFDDRAHRIEAAVSEVQHGRMDKADDIVRSLVIEEPDDPAAWHLLGVVTRERGRPDDAAPHLRRSLRLKPDYGKAWITLTNILAISGKRSASEAGHRAVALLPDQSDALTNLATAIHGVAPVQAMHALRRAATLRPYDQYTLYRLVMILARLEFYSECREPARRLLDLRPHDAVLHNIMADIVHRTGTGDPLPSAHLALTLAPEYPTHYHLLSKILWERGERASAHTAMRRNMRLLPDRAPGHGRPAFVGRNGHSFARIYHFHIMKTGGTSINYAFFEGLSGNHSPQDVYRIINEDFVYRAGGTVICGWLRHLIEAGIGDYAFSHIEGHTLDLPPDTMTITCLRNPAERVFSFFAHERAHAASPAPLHQQLAPLLNGSAEDFFRNLPKHLLLGQIAMFSPRLDVNEAADRILALDEVFFTEEMDAAFQRIGELVGNPVSQRHENQRRAPRQDHGCDTVRALVRDLVEPEVRLMELVRTGLGRSAPPPHGLPSQERSGASDASPS